MDQMKLDSGRQEQSIDGKAVELDRSSLKKVEDLLALFEEIHQSQEVSTDLLKSFQGDYLKLPLEEKTWFFEALIRRFEVNKEDVLEDLKRIEKANEGDAIGWSRLLTKLRRKLESPRMRAFRKLFNISGGLKFLLDLRADVLNLQRQAALDLDPLDEEIAHLFNSWFQQGFLYLKEITRDSSFRQIRFLKEHDLVHPMASLEEMGDRLGEDRRCFALYHLSMPEEPVVFIEVALTKGIVNSIHDVIGDQIAQKNRKGKPDTAIFYSINNTQNGLSGLGLGKVLIFQVVEALKRGNLEIKTFSTLSPIPGFWGRYLKFVLQNEDAPFALKNERLKEFFPDKTQEGLFQRHEEKTGREASDFSTALLEILSDPEWINDSVYVGWLRKPLTEVTYFYITQEKNKQGKPLNPVANFHMGNGATVNIRNVNFGANRSRRGLDESCGMMVNYVYSSTWLQQIGRTVESFLPWRT
jgi:hypothetical protein